ncbi:MAG TPA: hypothetical protein VLM85_02735 [Polyangiaceae bacterium]|nr:hypothetical protein [Polyangiaceae bacterium]
MVSAAASRVIAVAVLGGLDLTLVRVLRLGRTELRAAVLSGVVAGALDVVIETILGALGVWHYDLPFSILGTPIDLFFDVSLVALAISLGYAAMARRRPAWRAAYVVTTTLALGSWALFHNTVAVKQGIIRFAPAIDVGTAWFAVGNYALVAVTVVGVGVVYPVVRARL